MWFDIVLIVLWAILGIANLCEKRISKLSYACTWVVVMAYLVADLVKSLV